MEAPAGYILAPDVPDARARDMRNVNASTAVKSGLRVLAVFEYFRDNPAPARTSEVSRALSIPNSSVDEILKTLVGAGYLSFDQRRKRYAPAYRIVTLARRLEGSFFGGTSVSDAMEDLHRQTGRTVWLCMQNGHWVQCVAVVPGYDYQHHIHIEGFTDSDWSTAAGVALLSCQKLDAAGEIAMRMARSAPRAGRPGLFANLMERVGEARRQGFATSRAFSASGSTAYAMPFQPAFMRAPVAIGLVGREVEGTPAASELVAVLRSVIGRHTRIADMWRPAARVSSPGQECPRP